MADRNDPARWPAPQNWVRDSATPSLSLGEAGSFDDMHLFAPCVTRNAGRFRMWYSGSRDDVANRVFRLGLAESADGKVFAKHHGNPVLAFPDGRRSILTPSLVRNGDGSPALDEGRLRLYFAGQDFPSGSDRMTLHTSTSEDGLAWSEPSGELLEGLYAPTVLRVGDRLRMWFTAADMQSYRYAESTDGFTWDVREEPVVTMTQAWEAGRLFYPFVLHMDGTYLLWYGSYLADAPEMMTGIGFAVSRDGITWEKHPGNPVLLPDSSREWESHYVTSHTVLPLPCGGFRIWYATREKPPYVHKYFAVGTASWIGPGG